MVCIKEVQYGSFTLTRSGKRPLRIVGQLIKEASHWERDRHHHRLALYVTESGKHVVHYSFSSIVDGTEDRFAATTHDSLEAALEEVEAKYPWADDVLELLPEELA